VVLCTAVVLTLLTSVVLRTISADYLSLITMQYVGCVKAMAVIDNLFLLATGFSQIFTALTLFANQQNHWLSVYLQVFLWPFVHMTQLCTVWITVLIAFNRFIAICYPYKADRVCSIKMARLQVSDFSSLFYVFYIDVGLYARQSMLVEPLSIVHIYSLRKSASRI
jgi:hypothetical protein